MKCYTIMFSCTKIILAILFPETCFIIQGFWPTVHDAKIFRFKFLFLFFHLSVVRSKLRLTKSKSDGRNVVLSVHIKEKNNADLLAAVFFIVNFLILSTSNIDFLGVISVFLKK